MKKEYPRCSPHRRLHRQSRGRHPASIQSPPWRDCAVSQTGIPRAAHDPQRGTGIPLVMSLETHWHTDRDAVEPDVINDSPGLASAPATAEWHEMLEKARCEFFNITTDNETEEEEEEVGGTTVPDM